jgi:hypothetical protein
MKRPTLRTKLISFPENEASLQEFINRLKKNEDIFGLPGNDLGTVISAVGPVRRLAIFAGVPGLEFLSPDNKTPLSTPQKLIRNLLQGITRENASTFLPRLKQAFIQQGLIVDEPAQGAETRNLLLDLVREFSENGVLRPQEHIHLTNLLNGLNPLQRAHVLARIPGLEFLHGPNKGRTPEQDAFYNLIYPSMHMPWTLGTDDVRETVRTLAETKLVGATATVRPDQDKDLIFVRKAFQRLNQGVNIFEEKGMKQALARVPESVLSECLWHHVPDFFSFLNQSPND